MNSCLVKYKKDATMSNKIIFSARPEIYPAFGYLLKEGHEIPDKAWKVNSVNDFV